MDQGLAPMRPRYCTSHSFHGNSLQTTATGPERARMSCHTSYVPLLVSTEDTTRRLCGVEGSFDGNAPDGNPILAHFGSVPILVADIVPAPIVDPFLDHVVAVGGPLSSEEVLPSGGRLRLNQVELDSYGGRGVNPRPQYHL